MRSRRSSGTLATPTCASRGLEEVAPPSVLVKIRKREVLPTWGRPMMPVFIRADQKNITMIAGGHGFHGHVPCYSHQELRCIALVLLSIPKSVVRCLLFAVLVSNTTAQAQFRLLDQAAIESRLKGFSRKNEEREAIIKQLFTESGCKEDQLSEQVVRATLPPNVICVLPGETDG